uniref:Candidate secreted effector n=1 Tax=Meloidogyne incognita TaxID=6306 RepID=A0A914MIV4_MELIC
MRSREPSFLAEQSAGLDIEEEGNPDEVPNGGSLAETGISPNGTNGVGGRVSGGTSSSANGTAFLAAPTPIVTAEQGGVAATANGRKTASSIANKLVKPIKTAETNIGSGKGGSSKLSSEQIRVNNSKSNKMIGKGVDKSKNARLPIGKENTP